MPTRTLLLILAVPIGLELLFGVGLFGGIAIFASAILLLLFALDRKFFPHSLRHAVVLAIIGLSAIWYIEINWKVATTRAGPIIAAANQFKSERGRYPSSLNDLIPRYIPAIPPANHFVGRRFGYSADPPSLYFAVMFHGVASYDFQSQKWLTNE